MPAPQPRSWQPKRLDAGAFQPEIFSFRLHLAAEGKAAKTTRTYTEAVQWFVAAYLQEHTGRSAWDQVDPRDVREWMSLLLDRYSPAYASNQYRGLQQFLQMARRRGADPGPDDRAAASAGHRAAGARLQR